MLDYVPTFAKIFINKRINLLKSLPGTKWGADRKSMIRLFIALIRSKIDYGAQVYGSISKTNYKRLEVIQNNALK